MNDTSEQKTELPEELLRGDDTAWRAFLEEVEPLIRAVTGWAKWHFTEQARQDVIQAVQSDLPRALRSFSGQCGLPEYIKRITTYQCIDEVQRQVRARQVFIEAEALLSDEDDRSPFDVVTQAGPAFDPVRAVVWAERGAALQRLLNELDPHCADIIKPYHMQGLSYKDLADRLRISINTVCSRLARCHARLRVLIKKDPMLKDYFQETSD